jgi:hypothetical protein
MIFQYSGFGTALCPACRKKDDEDMGIVTNYLLRHPGASGQDVLDDTGVSPESVIKWMRSERLITPAAINIGLKCESCGSAIYKGKLCDECRKGLWKGFTSELAGKK